MASRRYLLESLGFLVTVGVLVTLGWMISACTKAQQDTPTEVMEKGDTILAALRKHKADTGQYPSQLSDLVPTYLDTVPTPDWGVRRWDYSADSEILVLAVYENQDGYPAIEYSPLSGWIYDH